MWTHPTICQTNLAVHKYIAADHGGIVNGQTSTQPHGQRNPAQDPTPLARTGEENSPTALTYHAVRPHGRPSGALLLKDASTSAITCCMSLSPRYAYSATSRQRQVTYF